MTHRLMICSLFCCLICALQVSAAEQTAKRIRNFAGVGEPGYAGDGAPAKRAMLNNPYGITVGPDRALYICDMDNHAIRKVAVDGNIQTVAGTGKRGYSGDGGPARQAELNEPYEVRFDRGGNMF